MKSEECTEKKSISIHDIHGVMFYTETPWYFPVVANCKQEKMLFKFATTGLSRGFSV